MKIFCKICWKRGRKTVLEKYTIKTKDFDDEFMFCPVCGEDRFPCEWVTEEEGVGKVIKKFRDRGKIFGKKLKNTY